MDISREIDAGELTSILGNINLFYAFDSNDALTLDKILDKANKGEYDTIPFRGLNLDPINPVEDEGSVEGGEQNQVNENPLNLDL